MDFVQIRQSCVAKGVLWEDPEFLPEDANIFYHESVPNGVSWKRPKEILRDPAFVIDDRHQFDIEPGKYGNPWLASVLGILYQYRGLFYRAVPADQGFQQEYVYSGIFHFRLWWAGEWTETIIDDLVPVQGNELIFAQTRSSMQCWAALLEKAYAKLHGSYEGIKYSTSADMFNELTGGITESLDLGKQEPHQLAEIIRRNLKQTSIPTAVSVCLYNMFKELTGGITESLDLGKQEPHQLAEIIRRNLKQTSIPTQLPSRYVCITCSTS